MLFLVDLVNVDQRTSELLREDSCPKAPLSGAGCQLSTTWIKLGLAGLIIHRPREFKLIRVGAGVGWGRVEGRGRRRGRTQPNGGRLLTGRALLVPSGYLASPSRSTSTGHACLGLG